MSGNRGRLRPPQAWVGCDEETGRRLNMLYEKAYLYARAAHRFLVELVKLPQQKQMVIWNGPERQTSSAQHSYSPLPAYWFGPYSEERVHFVLHTFRQVLERFEQGYRLGQGVQPVRIECLAASARKCRTSVLANASRYGTIRICPRLLHKAPDVGGMVILHEVLHQKLGVGDQRDVVCQRGDEHRCYRRGARRLVLSGKLEKGLRNNDNYAFFARAIYLSTLTHRNTDRPTRGK